MELDLAISVLRGEQYPMQLVVVGEAIEVVLIALAEREKEHEAWEWLSKNTDVKWVLCRGLDTAWKWRILGVGLDEAEWGESPLAAVLAAKEAKEPKR